MEFIRCTFSHSTRAHVLQIASPVPTKHWSKFDAILEWKEQTSQAFDVGSCDDERIVLPPMRALDATLREDKRRRDWTTYRKVVEADPNTTVAPPWPPFAPPPRFPSPELEDSPPIFESSTSTYSDTASCHGLSPANGEFGGYARWKYVLERFTPASPPSTCEHADGEHTSVSESSSPRTLSDTTGTTASSSLTSDTLSENAEEMSAAAAVQHTSDTHGSGAGNTDDLAVCIAQMLLECREEAELKPSAEAFFEEDALADGDIYDHELEEEIRERAAIAQELNWMLMGVLPMG
ncbi:hypothetical protein BD309DRAFT_959214 [Dichomitus squalens]|uniref:Uncharacterized protein n=2 Tax=Dichomitus squalens TaxID=114155 RepID=A0A4Q9PI65_9APHY|nr:uncharacterized protein DICSQDRAFT_149936 [Dichomitus squalens LYAD-421 SS1]EJF57222.1 hypothetical protein DICSQDRAFT_149936 [Dichomitus squalens LYAD-421 SS1]TBU44055.1 hypothetical protein BD309DRAFT_959214 [Dichomitus squalens]TBU53681.1 hypothetical protein BD310DRAFT_937487 [Dichomitus squalens]